MIAPDELHQAELFATLTRAQLTHFAARAADIHVRAREWIISEGDPPYFWVVLKGEVESVKRIAGALHQITTFDTGEHFGEVPLMMSSGAFTGVRAITDARLARIDPVDFHALITENDAAGALLAKSMARRVGFIRDAYAASTIVAATIVGSHYDLECHDLRDFLSRNQITFDWLDPADEFDRTCVPAPVLTAATYPVVLLPHGVTLVAPTTRELAQALGLSTQPSLAEYDVVIVGGGPAGLGAAVYGGSEGLRTLMIDREAPGGQAGTSSRIENYLGFPGGISGGDLADRALMQAKRFGTEIVVTRSVTAIEPGSGEHTVRLDDDSAVRARAVVIATGVAWRKLAAEGAERLAGRGVYYGAARTEGIGTAGKDVFLIGGGNSAGQAAMFFSNYARSVTLLVRGSSLAKSMSYYLIEQLGTKENISVETQSSVISVAGELHLESIVTRDERTGETRTRKADGLFAFIGADAQTAWLPDGICRDEHEYLRTGHELSGWQLERPPYPLETNIPGIFAAGDVRSNSIKRVASGVGEGSVVIAYIHQYLATLPVMI